MKTILEGARVIDATGAPALGNGVVVVEGERIAWVGPSEEARAVAVYEGADRTVDLSGLTLMPGLINCHEHLTFKRFSGKFQDVAEWSAAQAAAYGAGSCLVSLREGVTTVRDVGAKDNANIVLRDAVAKGQIAGPRIFASGSPISMTGGHGYEIAREVDGPDEVRKAVRGLIKDGADWIKVMASGGFISQGTDLPYHTQLGAEELKVAAFEAHNQGKKITAHCHPPKGLRDCVDAGFDCVEHGVLMDEASAELLAEHGTYLVPTVSTLVITADKGAQLGRPDWLVQVSRDSRDHLLQAFRMALRAGVRIAAGPDSIGEMARELELYVEGGMTPMQALQTATSNAADLLGEAENLGTIVPGHLADMIALGGNPLDNISHVRDVRWVMKGGRALDPMNLLDAAGSHMHYEKFID